MITLVSINNNSMEREHQLIPGDQLWKRHLYRIIYRSDTKLGKLFDIILLILILVSTSIIMMESIPKLDKRFHYTFIILEWIISIFFFRRILFTDRRGEKQKLLYLQLFRNHRFFRTCTVLPELPVSGNEIFPDFQNAQNAEGIPGF